MESNPVLDQTQLLQKIMQELQTIPETKLAEIYDLIHYFRLGLDKEQSQLRTPGLLTGQVDSG
ncbi:MAG: hypothetical protein ACO31I_07335 [Prochlorotrichaceae cyanobacterium]|jgi:hypothetical protein